MNEAGFKNKLIRDIAGSFEFIGDVNGETVDVDIQNKMIKCLTSGQSCIGFTGVGFGTFLEPKYLFNSKIRVPKMSKAQFPLILEDLNRDFKSLVTTFEEVGTCNCFNRANVNDYQDDAGSNNSTILIIAIIFTVLFVLTIGFFGFRKLRNSRPSHGRFENGDTAF